MRFFVEETSFTLPTRYPASALGKDLEAFVALVEGLSGEDEDIFY
jgi:hypothetical protein